MAFIKWPTWSSSRTRGQTTPKPKPNPTLFRLPSFKDLHSLNQETPQPETQPKRASIFHRIRSCRTGPHQIHHPAPAPTHEVSQPSVEMHSIVVYYTSLRVVRKTYEECRAVQAILRGFGVLIDERDFSMDIKFLDELEVILGQKVTTLPCVFIGGMYIGGAREVSEMNETGELKKLIQRMQLRECRACDVCGGHRFVVCEECNGSRKVYLQKYGGFKSCSFCNKNGLVRCPSCSNTYTCGVPDHNPAKHGNVETQVFSI